MQLERTKKYSEFYACELFQVSITYSCSQNEHISSFSRIRLLIELKRDFCVGLKSLKFMKIYFIVLNTKVIEEELLV